MRKNSYQKNKKKNAASNNVFNKIMITHLYLPIK